MQAKLASDPTVVVRLDVTRVAFGFPMMELMLVALMSGQRGKLHIKSAIVNVGQLVQA